jgi:hypothetical protein
MIHKHRNCFLNPLKVTALLAVLLCLGSCIGVSADIALNADGSGTLTLEYRLSRLLKTLGEQDGNERWYPLPVGEADFERTLARLPGMSLLSFSTKDDGKDVMVTAKTRFADPASLAAFLDAYGEGAVYTKTSNSSRLLLALYEGGKEANKELEALFAEAAEGYSVAIRLALPAEGTLSLLDRNGRPLSAAGEIKAEGRNLSFALPLAEIFTARDGLSLDFRW